MSCRSCKYLDVKPDAYGRVIPRGKNAYRCVVDVPPPVIPESIRKSYGYRWPPARSHMSPDDGKGCVMHEKREKPTSP